MRLKARLTVTAGVIPDIPINEHGRVYEYTDRDCTDDLRIPLGHPTAFSKMLEHAHEYAKGLSNPAYLNWVKVEWMWV